jgi:hypothetical protein
VMKRLRDDDGDNTGVLLVNQAAMCSLIGFYDTEKIAQSAQHNTDSSVFDSQYTYFIGMVTQGADGHHRFEDIDNMKRPPLLNTGFFLDNLKKELTRARAYLLVMGGVALWTVKDLARWLHLYANARTDAERRALGMPFGVLEAWDYTLEAVQLVGRRWSYVVHAIGDTKKSQFDCDYSFFDERMILLPLDPNELSTYERCASHLLSVARQNGGTAAATSQGFSATQQRVPQSIFYNLITEREQLRKTYGNLDDADWLASHPKAILRVGVPPETSIDKISDHDLYTDRNPPDRNSVVSAAMSERRRLSYMGLQQMANLIANLRSQSGGGNSPQNTPRAQSKRFYRHSDMLDDADMFDDTVELAHWTPPVVHNDYNQRLLDYKLAVLTAMGIAESSRFAQAILGKIMKEDVNGGAKSHMAMITEEDQRTLFVESEQNVYRKLFNVVYELCGFQRHDILVVSAFVATLDAIIEEEAARRDAVRNVANHLARKFNGATAERSANIALRKTTSDQMETEGETDPLQPDEILYNLRVKVADLRAWLKQTRQLSDNSESVELIFHNKRNDTFKLQYLQEMQAMGLVSVKDLEKQAHRVYGTGYRLHEPPVLSTKSPKQ